MNTTTHFITKDNWSGESAQFSVTEFAGTFEWEQNGYKIELVNRQVHDCFTCEWEQNGYKIELVNRQVYDCFTCYDIHIDGQFMDQQVGRYDGDGMWEATTWNGEMTRQASDPVDAAAKLLFNTL